MRFLRASKGRIALLSGLTVTVALAAAVAPLASAQAALSGPHWKAQTLPARYLFRPVPNPVSCVPGQHFCVVIAYDKQVLINGFIYGQAALVSTDGGDSWKGYATLPSTLDASAISCVSASVCWAAGSSWTTGTPAVAETTDGTKSWTDMTPTAWATATFTPSAIDCVTATTCWLAGTDNSTNLYEPAVASTTDGGASWTTYSNLPTFISSDPNGTYSLNGISCVSAISCVAVGGLNEADGTATVISTTDGGTTWSRSTDPGLTGLQQLFSVSCLPSASATGNPTCFAAGTITAAAGPAVVVSYDGGATWQGMHTFDNTGWLSSISCVNAKHCWAAGAGTTVALVGTSNGGNTWSRVTSDTTNEYGSVSCLNVNVCVATTDSSLWVTSDDGGIG